MGKLKKLFFLLLILFGLFIIIDWDGNIPDDFIDDYPGWGGGTKHGDVKDTWIDANGDGQEDVYVGDGYAEVTQHFVIYDRNSDGKYDAVLLDLDENGDFETRYLDENYDGKTDLWVTTLNNKKSYAWDLDADGIPDVYDTNGDGRIDAWDLNGDGIVDVRDADFDGKADLHDYDFDRVFDEVWSAGGDSSASSGTAGSNVVKITLSTPNRMFLDFSSGYGDENNFDIMLEPWCIDNAAINGNFADIGVMSLEAVTSANIPSSGYLHEDTMEIEIGHVYINKNSDGSYTAFTIYSHQKTGDCDHEVLLGYKNLG